ncbi:hypothetical protein HMPREF9372_2659, partial [Sporosarcina newyorkensis 2681]
PRRSANFATRRLSARPQESVHLERKETDIRALLYKKDCLENQFS